MNEFLPPHLLFLILDGQLYFSPESYGKINHKNHQPASYSFTFPDGDASSSATSLLTMGNSNGQGHMSHQHYNHPTSINHHHNHQSSSLMDSNSDSIAAMASSLFIPTTDAPPTLSIPKPPDFSEMLSSTSTTPAPSNHNSIGSQYPNHYNHHLAVTQSSQPHVFPSFYNSSHILISPPKSPVVAPILAESAFAQLQQHQNQGTKALSQSMYSQQIPIDYSSYFLQNLTKHITEQQQQQQQQQQKQKELQKEHQQQSIVQSMSSLLDSTHLPEAIDWSSILLNYTRGPISENLTSSNSFRPSVQNQNSFQSFLPSDEQLSQSVRTSSMNGQHQSQQKKRKMRPKTQQAPVTTTSSTTTTSTTTKPPKIYYEPQPEDSEEDDPPANIYSDIQLEDEDPSNSHGYDSSSKYYYYPVPSPKPRSKPHYVRRPYVYSSDLASSSMMDAGSVDYNQEEETQGDQRYSVPTSSYQPARYTSSNGPSSPSSLSSSPGYYHPLPTTYSIEDSLPSHPSNYYYDHPHLHDDIHRQGLSQSGSGGVPRPPGGFHSWSGLTGFLLGIIPLSIIVASLVPAFVSVPVAGAAAVAGKRRKRRGTSASALSTASMIASLFGQENHERQHHQVYHGSDSSSSDEKKRSNSSSTLRNEHLYTYKTIHPVIELLVEYGVNRLEDPKCLQELFCKVVAGGKKPRSNAVQRLFYIITSL